LEKLYIARAEYEKLSTEHAMARRKLFDTIRERQLLRFLSRFHVEDVTIPDFGPPQVVALVAFGVETAAEVERARLEKIRGLSSTLITQLLAWRWGLEGMFKFEVVRGAVAADQKALDHWYARRYRPLATTLTDGLEELRRKAALYDHRRRAFLVGVRVAAASLAQARANMDVF
jgi:DNA-binding helix-hairpin-helix protein with protein kinase domain